MFEHDYTQRYKAMIDDVEGELSMIEAHAAASHTFNPLCFCRQSFTSNIPGHIHNPAKRQSRFQDIVVQSHGRMQRLPGEHKGLAHQSSIRLFVKVSTTRP